MAVGASLAAAGRPGPARAARAVAAVDARALTGVRYPHPVQQHHGGSSRTMAKRARGSSKPGQRRPVQRQTGRPSAGLTAAEEARAAELEAQLVAQERAATEALDRSRDRGAPRANELSRPGRVPTGLLAQRAAEEYGYVVQDIRRITIVFGSLMVALIALWLVRDVANLF